MKRRSIGFSDKDYQKIKDFCDENKCSLSSFLEKVSASYFDGIEETTKFEHFGGPQMWVLTASVKDQETKDAVEIAVGKRGASCYSGIMFVFDNPGHSAKFHAQEAKRRILEDVKNIEIEVCGIERWNGKI